MEECKEANVLRAKLRQAETTVAELSAAATSHDNALIIKSLKRMYTCVGACYEHAHVFACMFMCMHVHSFVATSHDNALIIKSSKCMGMSVFLWVCSRAA